MCHHRPTAHPYGAEALPTSSSTPTPVTAAELQQLARMLRQITGELAAIHRHLSRVLAEVAEAGPMCPDTEVLPHSRPSDDAQRLLRRFELAIDVMSAEVEGIERRDYNR